VDERWVLLLNYWRQHEFRHALTFPFLIGALRIPVGATSGPGGDARKELEALVDLMRSHRAIGYFHHVYRCPDLGQLVVTKVVNSSTPPYALAIQPAQASEVPTLYVSDGVPRNSTSPFTSLVATIWNEVGSAIGGGSFSCRGKQFQPFNDDELRIIRKALA